MAIEHNNKYDTEKKRVRRGQGYVPHNNLLKGGRVQLKSLDAEELGIVIGNEGVVATITHDGDDLLITVIGGITQFDSYIVPGLDNTYSLGVSTSIGATEDRAWEYVFSNNPLQVLSDQRHKENITDASYGLKEIEQLRPVTFTLKGKERVNIGLIAQEVKELIPEAVTGSDDTRYLMTYESLIPVLINAVKELSAEVELLKAKLS